MLNWEWNPILNSPDNGLRIFKTEYAGFILDEAGLLFEFNNSHVYILYFILHLLMVHQVSLYK